MKAVFDVVPAFSFQCIMMSPFVSVALHLDVIVIAHFLRPRKRPLLSDSFVISVVVEGGDLFSDENDWHHDAVKAALSRRPVLLRVN